MATPRMTTLFGWGAQRRVECELLSPESIDDAARMLTPDGTTPRGLGRSYGDQATNAHGRVLGMTRLDRYVSFDDANGVLVCEAGASLAQIVRDFAPRGWFPAITPGTKFVTVGGCIANDVHGKAHHAQGTFVTCVKSMRVLVADGSIVTASRDENADLFWASFGGVGLLGVVVEATLQLRRIETTYFRQRVIYARDLTEMLEAITENDAQFPYSVANIDFVATGKHMGRGVLTVGDHARRDELPTKLASTPLALGGGPLVTVPFELPHVTLNPVTRRMVNQVIMTLLRSKGTVEHYDSFFYPLDMVNDWYRGYGPRGFIQYQFVLPFEAGEKPLRGLMETIMSSNQLPFLNVLKRMGPANQAPLSFPLEGYTFAIDFPVRDGLVALTRRLDAMVVDAGGRVYLGKDSFLEAATLRRMYSRVDEWLAVKRKWDPSRVFTSDLGRRLELA